jgi:hypothetical protein
MLVLTLAPLVFGIIAIFVPAIPFGPTVWFVVFIVIQIVHGMEVPFAIYAHAMRMHKLKATAGEIKAMDMTRIIWRVMLFGYSSWLPIYLSERKRLKGKARN